MTEQNINKIVDLYVNERKTTKEIAEILGNCSYSTVNRMLRKAGIELRPAGNMKGKEYHFESPLKKNVEDVDKMIELFNECIPVKEISIKLGVSNKAVYRKIKELGLVRPKSMMSRNQYDDSRDEYIINLYKEGKSSVEIAKIIGVTHRTVQNHLKKSGFGTRTISESQFAKNGKSFPEELSTYESFYDLYVTRRLSKKDLSIMFNVSTQVINRLLDVYNIHKRNCSESKVGLFVGSKHPNWKGGRTPLYRRIREYSHKNVAPIAMKRDHYKCQYPGCGSSHRPNVHHIKSFKSIFDEILLEHPELNVKDNEEELYNIMINDSRINDIDNLITYCRDCHLYKIHEYERTSK